MNFRLKTLSMLAAAAALTLTGCSNDDLALEGGVTGNTDYSGRVVYLNAGIALPTAGGTRSATDETGETNSDGQYGKDVEGPDFEYGYDYESEVRSVLLVLTNADDELMTYSVVGGLTKAPTTGSEFNVTAKGEIKYEALEAAYNGGVLSGADKTVNVYAFCNYTASLLAKIEKATVGSADWLNLSGEVVEPASPVGQTPDISNTIWAKRSFLMSNAEKVSYTFP
ncbi:MAG: hypothetical protein J1F25_03830, partial [Prevotellaceae bacterium]|nr:hypothetical protein [Prevotellaceae bacterium]